jgi:hypothetical protein
LIQFAVAASSPSLHRKGKQNWSTPRALTGAIRFGWII